MDGKTYLVRVPKSDLSVEGQQAFIEAAQENGFDLYTEGSFIDIEHLTRDQDQFLCKQLYGMGFHPMSYGE